MKILNHPPYSPDLSPCDFFLFPRLKKMLSGNKHTSRSSLGSAIYQCLQQIPKEYYLSAFHDWVKRLQKCVSVKGNTLKVCNKNIKRSTVSDMSPSDYKLYLIIQKIYCLKLILKGTSNVCCRPHSKILILFFREKKS